MSDDSQETAKRASDWHATMASPAIAAICAGEASVRRYTGTSPEMHQPPLTDNMLCMHLGGAKEVRRWHAGRMDVHSVELGALTTMPADQANRWLTRGPIDFAHLTLSPALIGQIALEEFDRDVASFSLLDRVGFRDPHAETCFLALLEAIERRSAEGQLYIDGLLSVLTYRLLERYSTLDRSAVRSAAGASPQRGGLAPWRLQRVVDFMQANLATDIGLAELTALTGLSRAQFFRAFRQSTGVSPYRHLQSLRLERAKALMNEKNTKPATIAAEVGFSSSARFATLFRQRFGLTPNAYSALVRSRLEPDE